jgi:hypothetical protein
MRWLLLVSLVISSVSFAGPKILPKRARGFAEEKASAKAVQVPADKPRPKPIQLLSDRPSPKEIQVPADNPNVTKVGGAQELKVATRDAVQTAFEYEIFAAHRNALDAMEAMGKDKDTSACKSIGLAIAHAAAAAELQVSAMTDKNFKNLGEALGLKPLDENLPAAIDISRDPLDEKAAYIKVKTKHGAIRFAESALRRAGYLCDDEKFDGDKERLYIARAITLLKVTGDVGKRAPIVRVPEATIRAKDVELRLQSE